MARKSKGKDGLTDQVKLFCHLYVHPDYDFNGKQAAIDAGYSPKTAEYQASRLLSKDKVAAYVDKLRKKRTDKIDYSADRVLDEIARCAMFNPKDMFDSEGNPIPINELPENTARAISGFEVNEYNQKLFKKIKTDKSKSLDLLARYHRLIDSDIKIDVTVIEKKLGRAKTRSTAPQKKSTGGNIIEKIGGKDE